MDKSKMKKQIYFLSNRIFLISIIIIFAMHTANATVNLTQISGEINAQALYKQHYNTDSNNLLITFADSAPIDVLACDFTDRKMNAIDLKTTIAEPNICHALAIQLVSNNPYLVNDSNSDATTDIFGIGTLSYIAQYIMTLTDLKLALFNRSVGGN